MNQRRPNSLDRPDESNLYLAKNHLSPDWYATSLNPWHEEAQPGTVINIDSLILQFPGPSYDYHTHVPSDQRTISEPFPDRRIPEPSCACIPAFTLFVSSKKIDGFLDEIIPVIYFTEQNYLRIMPIWNSI